MADKATAESNLIVESLSGSRLYGFNLPDSDQDLRGVYVPTKDYVLGLKIIGQDPIKFEGQDRELFSIGKFFKLLLKNNPNVMEILYTPNEKIIYQHPLWERVQKNASAFLSKKCARSILGYANAQSRRMENHKEWHCDEDHEMPIKEDYINTMVLRTDEKAQFIQSGWDEIELIEVCEGVEKNPYNTGYPNEAKIRYFRKSEYEAAVKKHHSYLEHKKNRNVDRAKLEKEFGYDLKYCCHLIRLLTMGIEILRDKTIYVDRIEYGDVQLYRDIRTGKYSYDEISEMADFLKTKNEELYETSDLRYSPDDELLNKLQVEIYEEYYGAQK